MIDFNLKVFIAVAKMRSFTRAAKLLNLSQPAVTHQIKNLELALRTKLFVRSQSRISLTQPGEILLKYAEDISLLYTRALEEIQESESRVAGDVHIGAASLLGTYLLPTLIGEFRKSYPDVNASMLVGNSKEIIEYLQSDVIELAIVSEPILLSNFEVAPLYRDFLTIIVYPGQVTRIAVRWAPTDLPVQTGGTDTLFFPFDPSGGNLHGYVWHCHIIDHEDNEMMRPDLVYLNPAGPPAAIRPLVKGFQY